MSQAPLTRQRVILGVLRIARGRADGIVCFDGTPQSFLASLAPLIAFPLVGALLAIFAEGPRRALISLAMTICGLLTPAVLSFELARFWHRSDAWLRFATAFNWCEWTLPIIAFVVMVPLSVAIDAGLDETTAGLIMVGLLGAYGLWLHWFLARVALALSGVRAALLVLIVNFGTAAVVMGPRLLANGLG